ncbi:MAG: hypothetical protein KAV82_15765, partial [Phycisphaerae bacterium]|nr:hypothetical protein [Phycisphaerae bacterium]
MLVWAPVSVAQNRTTGSENPSLRTEPIPADDLPPGVSEGKRLVTSNLRVASILSRLDIDGDGRPDNSPDTDGDGLPDNWEVGGFEARAADGSLPDRVVYFPAPSPIVPGTPPTPIFSRLPVATSAVNPDTDGDGVSDFTEVFGLLFIDENLNGILDSTEWEDRNTDGLPSPGEWPRSNIGTITNLLHDFDGFVFTDPTNYDTDGDGKNDREDNDPLINPRAFGLTELVITRANIEGDKDLDNDGLGDGMDIGNDLVEGDGDGAVKQTYQVVDNPTSIRELLSYFRQDLLNAGYIPESQIEDLLGQDWDANGLWRTTDVRDWSIIIDTSDTAGLPPSEYFCLTGSSDSASYACDAAGERRLYATQQFETLAELWNENSGYASYGGRGIGLGWNSLLKPSGQTKFIPDFHVWAILYSWRMPGFDIDGDGFIGSPNISSTKPTMADSGIASVAVRNGIL